MMAHRKALVAAAAVAAVLVAGAVAVGANVGILDGGNGGLGELSAASASSSGAGAVASVEPSTPAERSSVSGVQTFEVDEAGSVTLAADGSLLSVDSVRPADGWSWTTDQASDSELSVELSDGARTLVLHASVDARGDIRARVEDRSVTSDDPGATVSGSQDDRDHEEREHEEDEEREHDGDEHREDGEHHEYEGHDDDD